MRRVIIVILALAVMAGITASAYLLYKYNEQELSYKYIVCKERYVDSNNVFSARFISTHNTQRICGAKYRVEDGTLYITVFSTAGDKGIFPTDEDGYAKITFSPDKNYRKVVYVANGDEKELDFKRK